MRSPSAMGAKSSCTGSRSVTPRQNSRLVTARVPSSASPQLGVVWAAAGSMRPMVAASKVVVMKRDRILVWFVMTSSCCCPLTEQEGCQLFRTL